MLAFSPLGTADTTTVCLGETSSTKIRQPQIARDWVASPLAGQRVSSFRARAFDPSP